MSENIVVPSLGESISEATVSKWLKQKGEKVQLDEPIVELETDKVNVEVPSPAKGVITKINFKTLKVDGGLTNNNFLMQFQADLLGIPILVSKNTEITSLGVAKLASEKIMKKSEFYNDYKKYIPNKKNVKLLRNKYKIWMDKVRNNISIMEE